MKKVFFLIIISISSLNLLKSQSDTNVIYHDYIPDIIVNSISTPCEIDLNQDGSFDVKFSLEPGSPFPYTIVSRLNTNTKYSFLWDSLGLDSLSSSEITWISSPESWIPGLCSEKIGIKITVDTNIFFGWVKGSVSYDSGYPSITIDQYAFCKIPNYPFLWGQTEINTGISELKFSNDENISISINGKNLKVFSKQKIDRIDIVNMAGIKVKIIDNIIGKDAQLNIENLANGVYIISIALKNGDVVNKKVIIQ